LWLTVNLAGREAASAARFHRQSSQGRQAVYPDGMVEHDGHVGKLLDKIDQLGIADNTIIMYSTDNGAEVCTWPDGGSTPLRGEKDTNWEGGWRVPCAIRWPGVIKPGAISNDVSSHIDMLPTLLAAAGEPDIVEKCKKGHKAGSKTFKVHLDGRNVLPFLKGKVKETPRKGLMYWSDDGDLIALRVARGRSISMIQEAEGVEAWRIPFVPMRLPKLYHLRSDPFDRGDESMFYLKWSADRMFTLVPAKAIVGEFLKSFKEFPRQKPSSFGVEKAMDQAAAAETKLAGAPGGGPK
jgi:arylsulfatase